MSKASRARAAKHKKSADALDAYIVDCLALADKRGVRVFSMGVGNETTYQTFRRRVSWKAWVRGGKP